MLVFRFATAVFFLCALLQGAFGLSVSGNRLLDSSGNAVILRGVVKCSFEWSATGEGSVTGGAPSLNDYTIMRQQWNANVVRIPMNQDFWLSTSSTYKPNYRATIDQQVQWIKAQGMYVILDLHWSDQGNLNNPGAQQCMADADSATFWSQVAAVYKNDPYILFELYNEPHDVSWSVWLNGGSGCGYTVYGMQQLYNAVRATGAQNVVIVSGLNWAYDLTGVSSNLVVGTNIAYNTHPYNYAGKDSTTWDASFGYLAANYPVFATEFGQYCDGSNYVQTFLNYCQSKGIHWTAWAWYVSGCDFPSIISDWSGTPTATGAIIKAALATASPTTRPTTPPTAGPTTKSPTATATLKPTAAPTGKAPTLAPTKGPTPTVNATVKPTTAPTARPTSQSGGTTATITVVLNNGNTVWWMGFNSFSGFPYTVTAVSIKDSGNAVWQSLANQGWGWTVSSSSSLVAPVSIQIVSGQHVAILTNIVTNVIGGGSVTGVTTVS